MDKIIYLGTFLISTASYIVNISLSIYLSEHLGADPLRIGIAGFAGSFSYTLTTLSFSRLKRFQKFPWFIYSSFGIGMVYLLLPFFNYEGIFLLLLFMGFFYGRFWPSIQNYFRKEKKKELSVSMFNLAWSGGVIIGPLLSGRIYSLNSILPFIISGILGISIFFPFFFNRKDIISNFNSGFSMESHKELFPLNFVKNVRFLNYFNFFAIGAVIFLFPKLLLTLKVSPSLIGTLISVLFISRFISFYILRKKKIFTSKVFFSLSYFFLFFSLLLIGVGKNLLNFVFSMVVLGILNALSYHNGLLVHLEGGYSTEINEGAAGAGFFSGSLIVGILGNLFNLRIAFILVGLGILIAGLWSEKK